MREYIIRTKSGTEKCIVADNMLIDYINKKVTFWHKYGYSEYNGEYYNYYKNRDVTELPLGGIATIGVITYEKLISGELEIIYDSRTEQEIDFGRILKDVMKYYD